MSVLALRCLLPSCKVLADLQWAPPERPDACMLADYIRARRYPPVHVQNLPTYLPAAEGGDAVIELDGGDKLQAHSFCLASASQHFRDALACGDPAQVQQGEAELNVASNNAAATPRLPLPGTSKHQVILLLVYLYSWTRESLLATMAPSDLFELARVAHRFACLQVLQLVDRTLVKRGNETASGAQSNPALLNPRNGPKYYRLAHELQLTGFEAQVGCYIGKHADEMHLSDLHPMSAHIVRGALEACAELLNSMHSCKRKRVG